MFRSFTLFVLLAAAFTLLPAAAHAQRNCGTMDVLEEQLQNNPQRRANLEALEKFTRNFNYEASEKVTLTIPVVVHVVYRTSTENISAAQIQSQIQVLNDDFRRLNSDRDNRWNQAADSEIEFCLATVGPDGSATDGIIRRSTSVSGFGTNDRVKSTSQGGSNAWPSGDYLNMWVCNIGGGILGYAQFPGGPASTDGVVMDYRYFGTLGTAQAPFNLGRTATHEVGHWLNLRHIWGDGGCGASDFVSDTPDSDGPNYGCATGNVACSTEDMVQNYMDYSDDACMNLFTQGQKVRMRAALEGARASLLSSAGCGTPGGGGGGGGDVCDATEVTLTLVTDNYGSETTWSLTGPSGQVASGGPYGNNQTSTETFCLPDGCYDFVINDSYGDGICCAYGNGSYSISGGGVNASGGSFGSSETESFCLGNTGGGGGGNPEPPAQCSDVDLTYDNFNSNYGNWNDGGSDCLRSRTRAIEGGISVVLRDNTNSSVLTSAPLNLVGFEELTVAFDYFPNSMENGEDFWLQVNNGSGYQTVATWARGTDFQNNVLYSESITITGNFGSNVRVRFRCDASGNSDYVHLDRIALAGCTNSGRQISLRTPPTGFEAPELGLDDVDVEVSIFPNPANDVLNVNIEEAGYQAQLLDVTGRAVLNRALIAGSNQLDVSSLPQGVYLMVVEGADGFRETSKVMLR